MVRMYQAIGGRVIHRLFPRFCRRVGFIRASFAMASFECHFSGQEIAGPTLPRHFQSAELHAGRAACAAFDRTVNFLTFPRVSPSSYAVPTPKR